MFRSSAVRILYFYRGEKNEYLNVRFPRSIEIRR